MRKIHSCQELASLRRRTSDGILATINDQKARPRGNERKEEYLTRRLSERGYLLDNKELIIFDQYPLVKGKRDRIDIVYVYCNGQNKCKLGIVEAKIGEGGTLQDAIEQAKKYLEQLQGNNKKVLSTMARCKYNLKFSRHLTVGRIDILAPVSWWENPQNGNAPISKKIEFRGLSVNDDYLKLSVNDDYLKKDIEMKTI